MKNVFLFGLVLIVVASCTDVALPFQNEVEKSKPEFEFFDLEKEMSFYEQKNTERLANSSHLKKGCESNTRVPSEYPTIQEALDNVCEGGSVTVSAGTYTEKVFVNKPGIKIKAVGQVQLNGGFILNEEADGTTIQNFRINLFSDNNGIFSYKADNLSISKNEINDFPLVGNYGIILGNTSGSTIQNNRIDGASKGITIMTDDNNQVISQKNDISNNYVKSYFVTGISLEGNTDENSIKNNTVSIHAYFRVRLFGGGIALISNSNSNRIESCDDNQIKNNNISDGTIGILITDFNSGNEISGNQIYNHFMYGVNTLIIGEGYNPNVFKNNTVLGSGSCDIVNESSINIYLNNTADCTTGI